MLEQFYPYFKDISTIESNRLNPKRKHFRDSTKTKRCDTILNILFTEQFEQYPQLKRWKSYQETSYCN